jgi:hypothetical protein
MLFSGALHYDFAWLREGVERLLGCLPVRHRTAVRAEHGTRRRGEGT